jgi:hypothetical protein
MYGTNEEDKKTENKADRDATEGEGSHMIEYAWKELVRRKRRTIAHTAGYALAAAVIALVFTVLWNGQAASDAILRNTGTHFVAFLPLPSTECCGNKPLDPEHEGLLAGSVKTKVVPVSVLELARRLDTVADAEPFLLFRLKNEGGTVEDLTLGGVPVPGGRAVATNSCTAQDVVAGRFLGAGETGAAVVEQAFAAGAGLKPGSVLRLGGANLSVVGVVNTGIRAAKADVYLPLERARAIVNERLLIPLANESNLILVESKSAAVHEIAVAEVKRLLGAEGAVSSYNCYQPASRAMGVTDASAFLIALTVFVCLLAFSLQAQYARVAERRYDIGILKSIGWSRAAVVKQIAVEALIQAVAGWAAGSLAALVVFLFLPEQSLVGTQTLVAKQLFPGVFLLSLALAAVGGLVAGFLPGFFAASRKPAESLRRL